MAGVSPAVAICEMLDAETGRALPKEKAIEYAEEKGVPFVEGKEIVEQYRDFKEVKVKLFL
jgi:3,4-dihydroxy 2-butanone 4-phosphate synthase